MQTAEPPRREYGCVLLPSPGRRGESPSLRRGSQPLLLPLVFLTPRFIVASFASSKLELGNQMARQKKGEKLQGFNRVEPKRSERIAQSLEVEKYSSKGEWSLASQTLLQTLQLARDVAMAFAEGA